MAIEVKVEKQKKQESEYPKLMASVSGNVVLFLEKNRGILLVSDGAKVVGDYETTWIEEYFTDFDGTVTLSNKR